MANGLLDYVVSENAWLHPPVLRVLLPDLVFTPWSREHQSPTFLKPMLHRRRWRFNLRATSLFDKSGRDRQKFRGWPLCHDRPVSTFHKRWVVVLKGEHPFQFVSAVFTIYVHRHMGCHALPRNEHFPWEQYCEDFVSSSINFTSHPLLSPVQCFPFPGGNHMSFLFSIIISMRHLCVGKSIRLVRYVSLSLDPAMRSMLPAIWCPRPPTVIVPMKPSNACVLVCSKKMSGMETMYNFSELWQLFETIRCLIIGHAVLVLLL